MQIAADFTEGDAFTEHGVVGKIFGGEGDLAAPYYTALLHTPPPVQATSAAREATTSAGHLSMSGASEQRVGLCLL